MARAMAIKRLQVQLAEEEEMARLIQDEIAKQAADLEAAKEERIKAFKEGRTAGSIHGRDPTADGEVKE